MEINLDVLRKMQLLELKILIEIKRICDKHNIPFILIGGSLIGAIRHKGFIPWDDDIDIGMTRENFEKFCKLVSAELSDEFFFDNKFAEKKYYSLAKIRLKGTRIIENGEIKDTGHGFFVDIFPYDNIPNVYLSGYLYWNIFNILIRVFWLRKGYYLSKSFIARLMTYIGFIFCLPISNNKLNSILENYHKKYMNTKKNHVVLLMGTWGFKRERHLYSTITKITYVPFEGILMPIPEDYHLFLSEQYGDYTTPPPEKSRKMPHGIDIDFGIYS